MTNSVLILGASGRFGRNAAEAFWNAGWTVDCFDRSKDDLREKSAAADVIVNAWNPTYDRWADEIPGLTAKVIEAAKLNDATVIIPGNVYVFGAEAPETFCPDTPHGASNPLGRIRIEMEAAFRNAGVKTIVVRGGDYIDTEASGNWFDMIMAKHLAKGKFVSPGDPNVPRAWAYLPDIARACVALAEKRHLLATFEDVCFPGFTLSAAEMAGCIEQSIGRPVKTTRMNWLPIQIARPFWPMAKGILEMRYLWSKPHRLDGTKFNRLCPDFRPTPVGAALASAIRALDINPNKPVPGRRAIAAE